MATVLICAAHADDEALGCGGTMARHAGAGDVVHPVFVADGVASRHARETDVGEEAERRRGLARGAAKILGAQPPRFFDFPDQQLDQIPLIELCKRIELLAIELKPDIVYTHHAGDLNLDHVIVNRAVMTAFRPIVGQTVRRIYGFEVLSSTEWSFGVGVPFQPVRFVDITNVLPAKLDALRCYDIEMRPAPHARSYEAVRAQAVLRGASVGVSAAEAFTVLRELEL